MNTVKTILFSASAAIIMASCGEKTPEGPKALTQFDACSCASVEDLNSPDYAKCKELRNDSVFNAQYQQCRLAIQSGISDTSKVSISSADNATNLSAAGDGNYIIDVATSSLKWRGENVVGKKHEGAILVKRGNISIAGGALTGGELVIDMNTLINTDLSGEEKAKIESHLKSEDFFGVAKFGEASYTIVSGVKTNAITYDVKGKLTIKGNTHDLNCKLVVAPNGNDINVGGGFMFDRSAYDVRYGSDKFFENLGDKMIKNEVIMTLSLQGKKQ